MNCFADASDRHGEDHPCELSDCALRDMFSYCMAGTNGVLENTGRLWAVGRVLRVYCRTHWTQ